jgi:SAM-dependent methyltransferase
MSHKPLECRSCRGAILHPVLDLGHTPLANALLTADQLESPEARYPLRVVFCPACALVQLTHTVPPEELFSEYLYFSSVSDALVEHARKLAAAVVEERKLGADSLVVEIASNDGYLLQHYRGAGVPVLGIEPAANIARVAQDERGIRTLNEFFGLDLARRIRECGESADVIHAHNVLAHVADLNGVVQGMGLLLKPDGAIIIEVPYLRDLVEHCEFDTIYHEHLCYFSLTALDELFERNGLRVVDVKRVPIHGGTLRLFVSHAEAGERSDAVRCLIADEQALGMEGIAYYERFADTVSIVKESLLQMLGEAKAQGKRIAAYGAAAKGSTLLNFFGIGKETLDFVVDRSPHKQGRFMPGVHIPVRAPEALLAEMPELTLLLTWNFADEILSQQAAYRDAGGRFLIPIPEPRIV